MDLTVDVVEMPDLRVAAVQSDMSRMQEAWQQLGVIAGPAGLMGRADAPAISVFPIEATRGAAPHQLAYDAGVIVDPGTTVPQGLVERRIPAGRYLHATYVGPYEALGEAWSGFVAAVAARGERTGEGACYEIYRNHPGDTPPAELRTDLYIPLA